MCGYKEDEDEGEGGRLTGTEFSDVDLTDLEWADYDEKSNESTVISGKLMLIKFRGIYSTGGRSFQLFGIYSFAPAD